MKISCRFYMDHLTPQQRHKNMAAIHSKDTKPEIIVRMGLPADEIVIEELKYNK